MVYEIMPIYLGSIIPYITQPTRVFFIAQLLKCWPKGSVISCPVTSQALIAIKFHSIATSLGALIGVPIHFEQIGSHKFTKTSPTGVYTRN